MGKIWTFFRILLIFISEKNLPVNVKYSGAATGCVVLYLICFESLFTTVWWKPDFEMSHAVCVFLDPLWMEIFPENIEWFCLWDFFRCMFEAWTGNSTSTSNLNMKEVYSLIIIHTVLIKSMK